MRWWGKPKAPDIKQAIKDYATDHPKDLLPRVRVRPIGRAIQSLQTNPTDQLSDLYDPDFTTRQFYHPTNELAPFLQHVPVKTSDGWCDPPSPHRIQVVRAWREGKPVLQEYQIDTAEKLAELTASDEYRKSRLFESTGAWEAPTDRKYEKFVECYSPRDPQVQKVLNESARRLRESAFSQGLYPDESTAGSATANIDTEFIPIQGGPYWRTLNTYAHWEALAKAFEAKNHNELAKTCISATTDFTLGRQMAWKIRNVRVAAIWQEFWDRNTMDLRMRTLSDDLTWQGSLLIRKDQFLKGYLRIRSMDPGSFMEILTMPEDVEEVLFYHAQFPTPPMLGFTQFNGINMNIPLSKYVIRQYPANEIYHLKNNVSSSEKWGRSDFYASLGTLKRHRDWMNAMTLRDMLQANLVWKIKVHGDDADIQAFVSDPNNSQLPAYGGTWVENDALELAPLHMDVATRGNMGQGSVGAFLTALFASAQQMPMSYFNQMGSGDARANALVQGEPWVKKIDTRQSLLSRVLDHLYEAVMKIAVGSGRLQASDLRGDDADPEWVWPIIYEEDRKAKLGDLITAKGMGAISHRRMATTIAGEFQMMTYDYDEEIADIREEAKDELLKLWPPATGGPMAVTAPPAPTAPVPAAGAAPPQGAPVGNQAGQTEPQGDRAKLNSGPAKAEFKKQQANQEAYRLSESDREFLEQAIANGSVGEVQLPSGAVAEIRDELRESNPNHEPAGSPEGGQFASGDGQGSSVHPNLIEYMTQEFYKKHNLKRAIATTVKKFNGAENMFLGGKVNITAKQLEDAYYKDKAATVQRALSKPVPPNVDPSHRERMIISGHVDQFGLDEGKLREFLQHK